MTSIHYQGLHSCLHCAKRCSLQLSAPRFLVDVFSFVVHGEFQVGVPVAEEFRWKIFLSEDLQPLVVPVCHLHWKLFVFTDGKHCFIILFFNTQITSWSLKDDREDNQ